MMRVPCSSSSSCCCSLRSRLMAQGSRSLPPAMRGLSSTASTASCTLRASERPNDEWTKPIPPVTADVLDSPSSDNSGETVAQHPHLIPRANIILSTALSKLSLSPSSPSSPASPPPPSLTSSWFLSSACFMSPSIANPLVPSPTPVRSFSTMGLKSDRYNVLPSTNNNNNNIVHPAAATATAVSSAQRFTYHISASFAAKQKRFSPTTNVFNFNPYNRVQESARKKSRPETGQDAFFVSRINDSGAIATGVADGVGGYADSGIDSADFSHTFCERMATAAYQASPDTINAKQLIETGYQRILEEDQIAGGASTACVGVARPDGQLNVANLGDSGFLIIRQGRVHYASAPQTHGFNTPYQLAMIPGGLLAQARQFGGSPLSDDPSDALISTHLLRHGDVVIFATDGVWDNLSSQDVLKIVSDEMLIGKGWSNAADGIQPSAHLETVAASSEGSGIQTAVAKAVAGRAKSASINTKFDGPFAREVQRMFPWEDYHGGKKDDVCVVCMVVVETKGSTTPKL